MEELEEDKDKYEEGDKGKQEAEIDEDNLRLTREIMP